MSDAPTDRFVRLGLVGCGRVAEVGYVPALRRLPQVALAAVADPDPGRRARMAELAASGGAPVAAHAGVEALIAAGGVDGVLIASPPEAHLADARFAAEACLPALVEKPPAPDRPDAERLAALRPRPWVGFNRRFEYGAALRERVPTEGDVELELELRYRRASWRPYTAATDALADLGTHLVDLALFVTGAEPRAVGRAEVGLERARLELVTTRGVARIRCRTNRVHRELIRVRDAGGGTIAEHAAAGSVAGAVARLRRRPHALVASLARQLDAFSRAISGRSSGTLADAADGARAMAALDAARASARRRGAEVALDPATSAIGWATEATR